MKWTAIFCVCLAVASAVPSRDQLKRAAMEEALEEIMAKMEARKAEAEAREFIEDGTLSGTDEYGLELRRFAEQEIAESMKVAREEAAAKKQFQGSGVMAPNVIFFMIDDLGYNDIGWNNPEIISPNIDALAASGLILDQAYAQAVCSPSRGAFMTGVYPMHNGMQHDVILVTSPECGPADIAYLPEKLGELGYDTHMVGKWHLGFCNEACTPPERGFDTFYGFYQGYVSHYSHEIGTTQSGMGYDWHDQIGNDLSANGTYASLLLTDRAVELIENHDPSEAPMFMYFAHSAVHTPMEVDQSYKDLYPGYADHPHRQTFMGMVSEMDDSVGRVVDALKDNDLYDNTIIIFQSDNGGEAHFGSNGDFRGAKATIYEGGTRVPSMIHSPLSSAAGVVSDELFHITDWHATILAMAGGDVSGLDGLDQSDLILNGGAGVRDEVLYGLDAVFPQFLGTAGIRVGDWKLLRGYPGIFDGWESDGSMDLTHRLDLLNGGVSKRGNYAFPWGDMAGYIAQNANVAQLFNLADDPNERVNLAASNPDKVAELQARLDFYSETIHSVDLSVQGHEPAGMPENFGGFWEPGWC